MSDKSDPFQPASLQPGGLEGPAWRAKRAQRLADADREKFALRCRQAAAAEQAEQAEQPERRSEQGAAGDPREQSGQPKKADQRRDVGQDLRVLGEDRSSHAAA